MFEGQNPGLHYTPARYGAFAALADAVFSALDFPAASRTWGGSVLALEALIDKVAPPPESPEEKAARLQVCVSVCLCACVCTCACVCVCVRRVRAHARGGVGAVFCLGSFFPCWLCTLFRCSTATAAPHARGWSGVVGCHLRQDRGWLVRPGAPGRMVRVHA